MDDMHEVFESVARYFSVLGEPTRLRILHALCQEEKCVNEIIGVPHLSQANGSRHLARGRRPPANQKEEASV